MHDELVLVDQAQLRERQRERHAAGEEPLARLPLQLAHRIPEVSAHELRVPVDALPRARHAL